MKNVSDSLVCPLELVRNISKGGDVTHTAIETAMNKFVKKGKRGWFLGIAFGKY